MSLDAARKTPVGRNPDFHKFENFLFSITKEIDWRDEARYQIQKELETRGIRIPADVPMNDIEAIATTNGRLPGDLTNEYKRMVTDRIIRDTRMARDFRAAIAALGRSQLIPDETSPSEEEVLLGWLLGERFVGSAGVLKRFTIFEKISRSNAKFILMSLCHWLRSARKSGLIVLFDFRCYERLRPNKTRVLSELRAARAAGAPADELNRILDKLDAPGPFYSQQAYLMCLELMRHLIDDIERLPGLGLVVFGTPRFFSEHKLDEKERNFKDYNALQTRIGLEVHDVERQNPSASLVHLAEASGGGA